jgi:hypothetical protein
MSNPLFVPRPHLFLRKYPNSGGAFKVQIYSPYIVVNKTGLPFAAKSFRSTRSGPPRDVAGDSRTGFWFHSLTERVILIVILDVLSSTTPFCKLGFVSSQEQA